MHLVVSFTGKEDVREDAPMSGDQPICHCDDTAERPASEYPGGTLIAKGFQDIETRLPPIQQAPIVKANMKSLLTASVEVRGHGWRRHLLEGNGTPLSSVVSLLDPSNAMLSKTSLAIPNNDRPGILSHR
jgi:hypothetical protein